MPVAEVVDARVEGGGDRGRGGVAAGEAPAGGTQTGGATTGGGEPDASRDTGAGESDASTEPRPDLSAFDGYWYVDGFGPRLDGAVGAYAAGMRVERNRAKMLTYEDEAVALETSLVPATDRYGTWLLTNPVTGVVYRGAVAPTSGFAVFVADDDASGDAATVLIMARADDDVPAAPPDTLAYVPLVPVQHNILKLMTFFALQSGDTGRRLLRLATEHSGPPPSPSAEAVHGHCRPKML